MSLFIIRARRKSLGSRTESSTFGHSFACLSNHVQHFFKWLLKRGRLLCLPFAGSGQALYVSVHAWNLAAAAAILLTRTLNGIVQCKQCKGPCFHENSKLYMKSGHLCILLYLLDFEEQFDKIFPCITSLQVICSESTNDCNLPKGIFSNERICSVIVVTF